MDGPRLPHLCTLTMCLVLPGLAAAQSPARRVVLSVDVLLTHRFTDPNGATLASHVTQTAFRLQKVRDASGKHLVVLTYRPTSPAAATRATATPLDGGRIEYDVESGTSRVFDGGGRRENPRLSSAGTGKGGVGPAASWLDTLVLTKASAPERRLALERSHGRASGRVGRLARYAHVNAGVSEEVLADPEWAVPIEMTRRRGGAVESRTRVEYGVTPDGHRVRTHVSSEELIEGGAGRRSILAVAFSNVVAEGRQP